MYRKSEVTEDMETVNCIWRIDQKYDAVFEEENLKEAKMLDAKGLPGAKIYQEARRRGISAWSL